MDFLKVDTVVLVNSKYKLQKQGRILNLKSFRGDIFIYDSLFEGNTLGYTGSCNIFR